VEILEVGFELVFRLRWHHELHLAELVDNR
jgi:hypothetical protein